MWLMATELNNRGYYIKRYSKLPVGILKRYSIFENLSSAMPIYCLTPGIYFLI